MKRKPIERFAAFLLALTMMVGLAPGASAQEERGGSSGSVSWTQVDNDAVTAQPEEELCAEPEQEPLYRDDEPVRVSIFLEGEPTAAMFAAEDIAVNEDAIAYREELQAYQEAAAEYLSEEVLDGEALDVVWNLTLAANLISANVPYGCVEDIKAADGVQDVILEHCHVIQGVPTEGGPSMAVATDTTGASLLWESGYTGAGMRIAVIDTGLDIDHQSFNSEAFEYALAEDAEMDGVSVSSYDLLDKEEIAGKLDQLNVVRRDGVSAGDLDSLYHSTKIPFTYNYVDRNFNVTHLYDNQGEHGSHVAGITSANRYLNWDGNFVRAMDEVKMVGAAPDAQTLVMKVFGQGGGAWESDYMAAVEDAIVLGCDAVNISINYYAAGFNFSTEYQDLMERLTGTNMVLAISSANYSYWAEQTSQGNLYSDDVNFQTSGEPATYANTLSVASVDNRGIVSTQSFTANGVEAFYLDSSGPNNLPLGSLDTSADGSGTAYEYIFIDGYGKEEDFEGLDVTGKVVLCNRGTDVSGALYGNYPVKVINAVNRGAIGVIVCNNNAGTNGSWMNLYGSGSVPRYEGTAPAVMIDFTYGQKIKAASTPVPGSSSAYTGTITIRRGYTAEAGDSGDTMSVFTSWGGPGDLTIKPEISAPGGNIWSLNGMHLSNGSLAGGHTSYELMMGTSMATPHIIGISALLKQHIEAEGLSQSGLTDRALIQSLLMSTAEPMKDVNGNYYPVIRQGAGMVNAAAAVGADSYILMGPDATASWADGKVKAELGNDPGRTGVYRFRFTIHNLDGQEHSYALNADVFTQDIASRGGQTYLSTSTRALSGADVRFTTEPSAAGDSLRYDFDGSGTVDYADGTALLDYVTGRRSWSSLYHQSEAYFGRDVVDSYSAHRFLQEMDQPAEPVVPSADSVTVPAGGSTTVYVTITLDQQEMRSILADCPNGVYVEAYVKAGAQPTEEGNMGTSHSIPVLGFYGNWSDASMFDRNSYPVWEKESYLSHMGIRYGSYLTLTHEGNSASYYYGGNPYTQDSEYLPARNALNNQNGDQLAQWRFTQIRGSSAGQVEITNAANDNEVYFHEDLGRYYAAYNSSTSWEYIEQWRNMSYYISLNWQGTDASGAALPEGTTVNLTLTQAPELYVQPDGSVDWDALGKGASLTSQVTIDNTPPAFLAADYDEDARLLTVTARDTQYIAYVGLYTEDGGLLIAGDTPNQTAADETVSVTLDLNGKAGRNFLIQVSDYAQNTVTYAITLNGVVPVENIYYTGFEFFNDCWASYAPDGSRTFVGYGDGDEAPSFSAGAYAGGYLFVFDLNNDFYVIDPEDTHERTLIAESDNQLGFAANIVDMTYDASSETMYFIDSYYYNGRTYYELATIDLFTGGCTWVQPQPDMALYAIASDGSGTLYGIGWNDSTKECSLYRITENGTAVEWIGDTGIAWENWYEALHSMAWDSAKNELVLAMNNDVHAYNSNGYFNGWQNRGGALYTIDPETARSEKIMDLDSAVVALYTPADPNEEKFAAGDPSWVELSQNSMTLLLGNSAQLSARVGAWNAVDKTYTWSSSSPEVASVDLYGNVTAHAVGTAEITAASNYDPSVYASCTVDVRTMQKEFDALTWDANGDIWWSSFSGDSLPSYRAIEQADSSIRLASVTQSHDGMLYAATERPDSNDSASDLYVIDPSTKEATLIDTLLWWNNPNSWYNVVDLADAPHLLDGNAIMGINNQYVFLIDKTTGKVHGSWNWGITNLVGIAYTGSYLDNRNQWHDCYAIIDAYGDVYREEFYYNIAEDDTWSWNGTDVLLVSTGYTTRNMPKYNSASYGCDDAGNPYLFWSQYDGRSKVNLLAIDIENGGTNYIGTFEDGVQPVVLVTEYDAQFDASVTAGAGSGGAGQSGQKWSGPIEVLTRSVTDDAAGTVMQSVRGQATVQIVLDQPSTNGKIEIAYDADKLTLSSARGLATLNSINSTTAGSVVLAYAYQDAAPAETVVAELTFLSSTSVSTALTITTLEDGMSRPDTSVNVPVVITVQNDSVTVPPIVSVPEKPDKDTTTAPDDTEPQEPETPDEPSVPEQPETPAIVIHVPSAPTPEQKQEILSVYEDLDADAWYSDCVARMISSGLMVSTSSTGKIFSPDEPLTRGMLVTILHRAAGTPDVPAAFLFHDVQAGSWYADGVAWAASNDLVNGYSDGSFAPELSISRQELAVILWRLAQKLGLRVTADATALPDFPDGNEIASWAAEAMSWAYREGIITGYGDGSLAPTKGASRVEAAAMLIRFMNLLPAESDSSMG